MAQTKFIAELCTDGTLTVHHYVVDENTLTDDRNKATQFDNKLTAGDVALKYVEAHGNDKLVQKTRIIILRQTERKK